MQHYLIEMLRFIDEQTSFSKETGSEVEKLGIEMEGTMDLVRKMQMGWYSNLNVDRNGMF